LEQEFVSNTFLASYLFQCECRAIILVPLSFHYHSGKRSEI